MNTRDANDAQRNDSGHGRGQYRPRPAGDNPEWYTPRHVIELAHAVMGHIGLDPASCAAANEIVDAQRYYTQEDDGLALEWGDRTVWCNPPYEGGMTGKWYDKMVHEWRMGNFREGMFLANATTEVKWFQHELRHFPVLLFAGRLKFWHPSRPHRDGFFGSALVYFPPKTVPLGSSPIVPPSSSPYTPPSPSPGRDPLDAVAEFRRSAGHLGHILIPAED